MPPELNSWNISWMQSKFLGLETIRHLLQNCQVETDCSAIHLYATYSCVRTIGFFVNIDFVVYH